MAPKLNTLQQLEWAYAYYAQDPTRLTAWSLFEKDKSCVVGALLRSEGYHEQYYGPDMKMEDVTPAIELLYTLVRPPIPEKYAERDALSQHRNAIMIWSNTAAERGEYGVVMDALSATIRTLKGDSQ